MSKNTKIIIEVLSIAIGTFSVAVLAHQASTNLLNEDPKHKQKGIVCAIAGVLISSAIIIRLNHKTIKNNHS